jgi:hypothetical protein
MPSAYEKFNLASPPVFPSTILPKVDAYRVIACNVKQCASCSKFSVVCWQCCYGSFIKQNVVVSCGLLMGDNLLCLQYVIFRQKQKVQHSLIYWYNRKLCTSNKSFNTYHRDIFMKIQMEKSI